MPETMVLRFRDLVVETVPEHQKIIAGPGHVWWGWWSRPSERIPRHTFAHFKGVIEREGSLPIFLIDSGREQLYRAALTDIRAADSETEIPSPDPDSTPIYYRSSDYKAWFRLTEITPIDQGELRAWSYDEVAEFVDDPYASRFQGKRIFSAREMLDRRHRTIYFLQKYLPEHRDHLVELVPPLAPANFVTTPIFAPSSYIVHLSDLHFGRGHHAFAVEAADEPRRRKLSTALIEDLRREYKGAAPAAVVISGDFTWQGTEEEYGWAAEFIGNLQSAYGLGPEHFLVVPGNHDVQWTDPEGDYDRTRPVSNSAEAANRNYRSFYKNVFGVLPNDDQSMGRRIVLRNFTAVDLLALNSSVLERRHFAGYGFVSLEQLERAASEMGWSGSERETHYRFLILHHHLVPVTPKEELAYDRTYSLTLDAGQILFRALQLGVDVALHGHMHQPFVGSFSRAGRNTGFPPGRTLTIHGAGSAGVKRDHTGGVGKNSYTVLDFGRQYVTLRVRSWSEDYDGFGPDWACRMEPNPHGGLTLADIQEASPTAR